MGHCGMDPAGQWDSLPTLAQRVTPPSLHRHPPFCHSEHSRNRQARLFQLMPPPGICATLSAAFASLRPTGSGSKITALEEPPVVTTTAAPISW